MADEKQDVISLPMASDTLRNEAHMITEAAKRAAEQMALCLAATRDAQARIRNTQHYVEDLDRHGSIDPDAAKEILRRLLGPDERDYPMGALPKPGRLERALIEIEHHSTDKNAAATARAALELAVRD